MINTTICAEKFQITAEYKPFGRSVTIFAAACAIIFSIIGVLGNILNERMLWSHPLHPSAHNSRDLNL